jgi:hypothetical protein
LIKSLLVAAVLVSCLLSGVASAQFFPPRTFSQRPDLEELIVTWYSAQLSEMREPSLFKQKEGESYRFLWLRSFHRPYAFRLQVLPDGTGTLTVKSTNLLPDGERGRVTLDKTRRLSAVQMRRVLSGIEALGFWSLPTKDLSRSGFDGAQWVFEGTQNGRYHIVDRWSPDDGAFRELMLALVQLAGVKVQPVY